MPKKATNVKKAASAKKAAKAPAKAAPKPAAKAPKATDKATKATVATKATRATRSVPPAKAADPAKPGRAPAVRTGTTFPPLEGQWKQNEALAKHTTFKIGGPARYHFTPASPEAVVGAVRWAREQKLPWLVLGLGSNVLIRDQGFPGLVLKLGKGLDTAVPKGATWRVGAGLPTPLLARRTAEAGLSGVQRLIGVPGTVGGGVFMNAGCHGQEFAAVLQSVTVLTPSLEVEERPRKAIGFSYRRSGLDGHVVLGCTLKLEEERADRVKLDLQFYLKKRREGTPFDQPCCGSVFKNPTQMTAGRLIERCGLKGRRVGAAEISSLHANYIVNKGGASADDVLKLIDVARTAVFKDFGIELELEVKVLGGAA